MQSPWEERCSFWRGPTHDCLIRRICFSSSELFLLSLGLLPFCSCEKIEPGFIILIIMTTANTELCSKVSRVSYILHGLFTRWTLTITLWKDCSCLHFIEEETELQRGAIARVSCLIRGSARIWACVVWLQSLLVLTAVYCSSRSSHFSPFPFTTCLVLFLRENCFLVAEWPWAIYLISLCFSFFIVSGDSNGTYVLGLLTSEYHWVSLPFVQSPLKGLGGEGRAQGTGRQKQRQTSE